MTINKENLNSMFIIDGKLHDSRVISFNYDPKLKKLEMITINYLNEKIYLDIENVQGLMLSYDIDLITESDILIGWESIPNNVIMDDYLSDVRDKFIKNGGEWNDSLFAVRFLFANMGELKIVCEKVTILTI